MKKIQYIAEKIRDELIFVLIMFFSLFLLKTIELTDIYGLWGSLVVVILGSIYYSYTFFNSGERYTKLYFFISTIFFIIAYFALVYKAFGIVDTSTSDLIKPDWLNAFYFSVVTWTTLGYGDFKPIDDLKVWVMVEAMMGYIYMGLLVGKVLFLGSNKKD